MTLYHGDIHADITPIYNLVTAAKQKHQQVPQRIIILGDVGVNFFRDGRDSKVKRKLNKLGPTILCLHGNHEARPQTIPTYHLEQYCGGQVMIEDEYPNLKFLVDGEIYDIDGKSTLAIGGAYSVDKYYRLQNNYIWYDDEQPNDDIKDKVILKLTDNDWRVDQVISHTCPAKFTPIEAFSPGVDQSRVDTSTEDFLDKIENNLDYERWLCGHWHIDKHIGKMNFLYREIME